MSNADIRGRFMWHELMTTDTDAASAFYSKVMPWKTQPSGMPGYTLWYAGKTQAGGLMALPDAGAGPHWLTYIGTPSVDSSLEGVQRLGGRVIKGATDIPNVGRYAVVADPQGAAFALYTPASAPTDGAGAGGAAPGGYSWHELATTDLDGAVKFYTELFGWEKGPGHDMGGDIGIYQLITQGGQQVGGIFKSPNTGTPPNWLTYVHVADIDKAVSAVKGGGGRVMNGPHQVPGGSWILQAMDPQGGMFAVIEPAAMAAAAAEKPAQPPKAAAKPAAPKPAAAAAPAAKEAAPAAAPAAKPAAKPAAQPAAKPVAKKAAAPKKAAAKAAKKAAKKAAPKKAAKKKGAAKRGAAKKAGKKPQKKAKSAAKGKGKGKAKSKARKAK